jgi:hypothetical protein
VDQAQVDINGNTVGRNRPDLQFTLDGQRFYVEYDPPGGSRATPHMERLLANDPDGAVVLRPVSNK